FGPAWVETQPANGSGGELEVRLKPLDEFRCLLEQAGKFILIPGEELSDQADGKPVHMNATNVTEALQPVGGATVEEVIRNNLRLILEHEHDSGRQLLAHLNHPNFHYAVTAEDLARVVEEQFFEVYNGHPGVNHLGDDEHMSIETMWDVINAMRMVALDADPILGIATDDSHEYHGQPGSRPGRGWVMVRARYLTPEHLIRAIKAGEFYASSGVVLDDVRYDAQAKQLSLAIRPAPGATYTTEFIALKKPAGAAPEGETAPGELPEAEVVARVSGLQPSYQLSGDEFYVRALVTSSLGADDPSFADQKRQAWTQPVGWRAARSGQP
ncbi:MAG: hypothetical protein KDA45_01370, partial [Planctomycetales bacterium]|nr:hypothetical protein [Planctomycetales bacterium]